MPAKRKPPARAPRKRATPAVLDRVTQPDQGGSGGAGVEEARFEAALWQFGLLGEHKQQVHVNQQTALTFSAVWACVRYIAQTIAALGWAVFESAPGDPDKRRLYEDVWWLLDMQASPEMDALNFRQVLVKDALTWGNGYAEIERDGFGRPRWLWRIGPDRVKLRRDGGGAMYYEVDNGPGNEPTALDPANVFHLKGLSPDGLVGYSVISMARATIRLALETQQYGETYFGRGPMPGGMLEIPGAVKKEERDETRKSFEKTYGGAKNAGRVVVLTQGMKFSPLTLPNEDAQWLESRKFQITEVARWYGVPPHKIADLEHATFSNIEQESISVVQDCLLPWCRRLEAEADLKLFGRVMRGRRWTKLNLNTLLRGDSATQVNNIRTLVTSGVMLLDEGREYLDMNPLPDGLGKTPLIQGAMVPVERAVNPPEPPPAPGPPQQGGDGQKPAQKPAQEGDKPAQDGAASAQIEEAFFVLLSDVYQDLLRVEKDKAKRADNKGDLRGHAAAYYTAESDGRVARMIRPAVAALLVASGRPADAAAGLAADLARDHNRRSVAELAAGTWASAWSDGRAAAQARDHLGLVRGAMA